MVFRFSGKGNDKGQGKVAEDSMYLQVMEVLMGLGADPRARGHGRDPLPGGFEVKQPSDRKILVDLVVGLTHKTTVKVKQQNNI